jgi:glycosyltransferase involved in cell wall biosynthesis
VLISPVQNRQPAPFFSVIIPTYNRGKLICRAIDSVVDQTFTDFEILVMDDGSTDGTANHIKGYADSRIKYEWAPNSGGPATPRNRGMERAEGKWIAFLDADDLWYPNKLEAVSAVIKETFEIVAICHNEYLKIESTGTKKILCHGPYERNFYEVMLTQGNRVSTSAVVVLSDFIKHNKLKFNTSEEYAIVEDYDMWLRIALNGGRFHFLREPLGEYVIESGNLTSDLNRHDRNRHNLLRDHVYHIQCFDLCKDRIWAKISVRLSVLTAKRFAADRFFYQSFVELFFAFLRSPVGFLLNFSWLIKRKVYYIGTICYLRHRR